MFQYFILFFCVLICLLLMFNSNMETSDFVTHKRKSFFSLCDRMAQQRQKYACLSSHTYITKRKSEKYETIATKSLKPSIEAIRDRYIYINTRSTLHQSHSTIFMNIFLIYFPLRLLELRFWLVEHNNHMPQCFSTKTLHFDMLSRLTLSLSFSLASHFIIRYIFSNAMCMRSITWSFINE